MRLAINTQPHVGCAVLYKGEPPTIPRSLVIKHYNP
jgi:hypothetical protein